MVRSTCCLLFISGTLPKKVHISLSVKNCTLKSFSVIGTREEHFLSRGCVSSITRQSVPSGIHPAYPTCAHQKGACTELPLPRNRELAVGDVVHFEDESVHTFTIAPPARIQKVPIRPCLVKQLNCPNACHQELADVWNVWPRREPEGDDIAS